MATEAEWEELAMLQHLPCKVEPHPLASLFALWHEDEAQTVRVPAHPEARVRGQSVAFWQIAAADFSDICAMLEDCDDPSELIFARIAAQVLGIAADGSALAMDQDDARALGPRAGRALARDMAEHGDLRPTHAPELVKPGDAIDASVKVRLSGQIVRFKVKKVYQLRALASGGSMRDQFNALMEISDAPDMTFAPEEGWFLLDKVLKPIRAAAKKLCKSIGQVEFHAHLDLNRDSLRVAIDRVNTYATEHRADRKFHATIAGAKLKGMN